MARIRLREVLDKLANANERVFTLNEVAKITGKGRRYLSRLLSTSKEVGHLERNKYYVKGTDIYVIASNVVEPSYVSMLSAFRFYDLTTQEPVRISVITPKRHKRIDFNGMRIDFINLDRSRVFGYKKIDGVFVATIEKAVVDSLYTGDPPYAYVEEAFRAAKGRIDIARIKEYAIGMHSKVLISKLGFMLESFGISADDLLPRISSRIVSLPGSDKRRASRWNVSS